jgi:hypothetical protein
MSRRPEAERDRVAPAWTINPVRGIVIGLIVIAVLATVLIVEMSRPSPQYPKHFLGFTRPLPGAIFGRTAPVIRVSFQLGYDDGRPLNDLEGESVQTQVRISSTRGGSSPMGVETCARHPGWTCALTTPNHVVIGVPYYLIVYQRVGDGFVAMPAVSSSNPNLMMIRFR